MNQISKKEVNKLYYFIRKALELLQTFSLKFEKKCEFRIISVAHFYLSSSGIESGTEPSLPARIIVTNVIILEPRPVFPLVTSISIPKFLACTLHILKKESQDNDTYNPTKCPNAYHVVL